MTKLKDLIKNEKMVVVSADTLKQFLSEVTKCGKSEGLLTSTEFCAVMGINRTTLWRWCKSGEAKQVIIGKKKFYKLSES